ncbi:MAG: hypothetical protein ACK55Z_24225, partial [bacterium]
MSNDVANKSTLKKGTLQIIRRVVPIRQDIAYSFCFTGAETEIHKIKDDSEIKREKNLNRRGRDILRMFYTFPNPLLSRCRLPLKFRNQERFLFRPTTIL